MKTSGEVWHFYAKALKQGEGQAGLEQFVAYVSDRAGQKRGAIICEKAPGRVMARPSPREIDDIPREHFDDLMQVFQAMEARRLVDDASPTNLMYDPEKGFTIIDYWALEEWRRLSSKSCPTTASGMAANLVTAVAFHGSIDRYVDAYRRAFGEAAAEELQKKLA